MHLVLARSLRVLAAALFATGVWADAGHASQCVWGEVEQPDPRMAAITHAFLTSSSFRLGSQVYPVMPASGFPIRFLSDGILESKQYPPGTRWAIIHGGLKLMRPDGLPSDAFVFDPTCGTLLYRHKHPEGSFNVEIRLAPRD
jgi:hypothetical protein